MGQVSKHSGACDRAGGRSVSFTLTYISSGLSGTAATRRRVCFPRCPWPAAWLEAVEPRVVQAGNLAVVGRGYRAGGGVEGWLAVLGESVESDGGVCRGKGRGNNGGRAGVCACVRVSFTTREMGNNNEDRSQG